MTAIHETAYPRIRSNLSDKELTELYTPTQEDLVFINQKTQSTVAAFGGLVLYKTFQRLGYFPSFDTLPPRLITHIARAIGVQTTNETLVRYEQRGFRKWHLPLIRSHLGITAFDDGGRRVLLESAIEASRSKDIEADIINTGIESLVAARYELPAFSTLRRAAMKARAQVNKEYYHQVYDALSDDQRASINQLLTHDASDTTRQWQRLKREPKQPTTKQIRQHIDHLRWLESLNTARHTLDGIPETKLERFAAEAKALNVSRMNETLKSKRFTLAVALISVRTAQALDDLAEMFIRRMQKLHHKAKEALEVYRRQHQEQTDTLISLLGKIAQSWQAKQLPEQKVWAIDALIGDDAETIEQQCEAHIGYAGNNYLPFLPALFRNHRKNCLDVLECLAPTSTSADTTLEEAITFVLRHRNVRAARIPITGSGQGAFDTLSLSWIPPRWWKAVTGSERRDVPITEVSRKYLELCVLSCAMLELKEGDLFVAGSERFSDYRDQWVTWEEYERHVETYCQQVGIDSDPARFVSALQTQLTEKICATDAAFPTNTCLTLIDGEPVVRRLNKVPQPFGFTKIEQLLKARMPECNIVDVLTDTEHWLRWTDAFGPLSGFESQLTEKQKRYVTTTFCYGCYLGPTQTSRSIEDFDRFQVAYVNHRHITEQSLLDANVNVINRYNQFMLPKLWGAGKRAAADGTKWDVYEQNLRKGLPYSIRWLGWNRLLPHLRYLHCPV